MASTINVWGDTVTIKDDLLRDFFDEAIIEEKDLHIILDEYEPETRVLIGRYIIARLCEVDPGYLPNSMFDEEGEPKRPPGYGEFPSGYGE